MVQREGNNQALPIACPGRQKRTSTEQDPAIENITIAVMALNVTAHCRPDGRLGKMTAERDLPMPMTIRELRVRARGRDQQELLRICDEVIGGTGIPNFPVNRDSVPTGLWIPPDFTVHHFQALLLCLSLRRNLRELAQNQEAIDNSGEDYDEDYTDHG